MAGEEIGQEEAADAGIRDLGKQRRSGEEFITMRMRHTDGIVLGQDLVERAARATIAIAHQHRAELMAPRRQHRIDPRGDLAGSIMQIGGQALHHHLRLAQPQLRPQIEHFAGQRATGQDQRRFELVLGHGAPLCPSPISGSCRRARGPIPR